MQNHSNMQVVNNFSHILFFSRTKIINDVDQLRWVICIIRSCWILLASISFREYQFKRLIETFLDDEIHADNSKVIELEYIIYRWTTLESIYFWLHLCRNALQNHWTVLKKTE